MDARKKARDLLEHEADTFIETLGTLSGLKAVAHPQAETLDENPVWRGAIMRQLADIEDDATRMNFAATLLEATPIVPILIAARRNWTETDDETSEGWRAVTALELAPIEERDDIAKQQTKLKLHEKFVGEPDFEISRSDEEGATRIRIKDTEIRVRFWQVIDEMRRGAAGPTHAALLMRSLLTMAVSTFEVLVANIYRCFLTCNPGAGDATDSKTFSLNDLFAFGSIQDAIDESIFQQSDSFSRKGIRAWHSWFKAKPLQIDLSELAFDWPRTMEVFERRNVVVHNGSRVTRQYLQNVDSELTSDLFEGHPLEVTPQYVDEALERLLTLGTLLAYRVRVRLFRRDDLEEIAQWISTEQFSFLCDGKYHAAEIIALCAGEPDFSETDRLLLKINGWIAQMMLYGPEFCRDKIQEWDTSALAIRFQAARLVLLQENERAIPAVREAMAAGDFGVKELREWPLFHWMREDGALDELMEESAEDEAESETVDVADFDPSTLPTFHPVRSSEDQADAEPTNEPDGDSSPEEAS